MGDSIQSAEPGTFFPDIESGFRALFLASPDPLLLVALDGAVLDANPAACRFFACSAEDLRSGGRNSFADEADPRWRVAFAEVARHGRFHGALNLIRHDGSKCQAGVFAAALHQPRAGEPIALVIQDAAPPVPSGNPGRVSERYADRVIEALSAHICVLDADGTILSVNRAWREFGAANQADALAVAEGVNYLAVCDRAAGSDDALAAAFAAGVRAVVRGEKSEFTLEYPCHSPEAQRWFLGRVSRFTDTRHTRIVVAHENITERKKAEEELRASRELLRALAARQEAVREEERAHIAREIHDILAQELTRLKIDLVWLQRRLARPAPGAPPESLVARVAEMSQMADTTIRCVQRIATGLRPAVLDSLGLGAAVEWQVRDFQAHTGIPCQLDVPAEELPVGREVATAAFRILQESLTNVTRHAVATHVTVALAPAGDRLVLRIADNGRGFAPETLRDPLAIGLAGMRERAFILGGTLGIRSQPGAGTVIEANLPLTTPAGRPAA